MIRNHWLIILAAVLSVLILAGCQPVDEELPISETALPAPAVTIIRNDPSMDDEQAVSEPPIEAITNQVDVETSDLFKALDCGEKFCQVPWPGIIERPVSIEDSSTIDLTYLYASTRENTLPPHHGIEFLDPFGTPILAVAPGEVVFAGIDDQIQLGPYFGFYGQVIILRHPDLLLESEMVYTLYGHLSEIHVAEGQAVDTGDLLGEVGFSGWATGPHLHFEVRVGENDYLRTVNPILWFSPLQSAETGEKAIIAGVIKNFNGDPVPEFEITLEKLGQEDDIERFFYPKTYTLNGTKSHPILGENFAFPDLPAGDYRLSYIVGRLIEHRFTLEPGGFGFIKIQFE